MKIEDKLFGLFKKWDGNSPDSISPLPISGSARKYYRIKKNNISVIGVFGPEQKETQAFISFSKHFKSVGLNVPDIYTEELSSNIYLEEDLGDQTLFKLLKSDFKSAKGFYKKVVEDLISFQVDGNKNLDFSVCYPRSSFDNQSMQWDLNYFKYYFLKPLNIFYDEQKLEDDFHSLINFLSAADSSYFLYRDFQSRNILIKDRKLFYIDYQGGRKGALQYDLASLLFDAKADLLNEFREELLSHYIELISTKIKLSEKEFRKYYYGFVLIRILQAMGAYGFRGIYEGKTLFLQSIPYALKNLKWLLSDSRIGTKLPELESSIKQIINNEELQKIQESSSTEKLKLTINSFSYRDKIPNDYSGNGGGFVFDCRGIENPGRQEKFKNLTGLDKPVQDFLEKEISANEFLRNVFEIIGRTINNYSERKFTNLQINFGCTGGQHRSVYCAKRTAEHFKQNKNILVELHHLALENKEKEI
jgi:aminoglycoside/choline kinase family phosphotransferase